MLKLESRIRHLHRHVLRGAWTLAYCFAAGAMAQGLSARYHTQSDGLGNLAITALTQMSDGRLWIGTENGLYMHDGARIARVDPEDAPMPSRHVSALAGDGQGGLWIGTKDGIFHMGQDGLKPVEAATKHAIVRQGQTIAAMSDGGALVATVDGLYSVRHDASDGGWRASAAFPATILRQEPSLTTIHAVLVDRNGTWWLGCGNALCHWSAGVLQRSNPRSDKSHWAGLLRTRDGALWVRSQTQVMRQGSDAEGFMDVTPPNLSHGVVHLQQPLVEDDDSRVMTPSDTGLLRWQASRWEHFGAEHGITVGGGVHAILVDRDQDVWLGTAGHGLAHWRGYRHWRQWTQRQGLPTDDVWSFAEDASGRLWMGTGDGSVVLEHDPAARLVPQGGTHNQVGSIVRDASGQIWMGTYSGELFRRLAGGGWQRVASGLPLILTVRPAADSGLWVGSDEGLYFVELSRSGSAPLRVTIPSGIDPRQAKSISIYSACTLPQGRTWMGTSVGLFAHEPAHGVTHPEVHGLPVGLAIDKIACGRDGTLWAGTRDNRIWRIVDGADGWRAEVVQSGSALGRRSMMALLADSRGWLWATTDDGVLVWNGRQWRRFDESNGLVWNDCNQGALYEDQAGNIWIGTSRGASQVVAPERLFDTAGLDLRFTQVVRDGRELAHDQPWTGAWSAGSLQITWAVPTFINRSSHQVRYRLRGLSEQWSATQHDDVSFSALPAGRYTFEAQAENVDLGLVSPVAALEFEVLPPWWLSRWTMAAYGLATIALVVLAYRWRVGALLRHRRELEVLVGQRTVELKTSYEQMRTLALTDGLTGAMNRRAITDLAERELAHARRGDAPVVLMLVDVDHFKRINDTHGHPAGDAVLVQLVLRLRAAMRSYDTIGRWGGEEFLLVLPGLSLAHDEGRRRAERLQRCVAEQPFDIGIGTPLAVTCSAGVIAVVTDTGETLETLMGRADAALYSAKHEGRNRTVFGV